MEKYNFSPPRLTNSSERVEGVDIGGTKKERFDLIIPLLPPSCEIIAHVEGKIRAWIRARLRRGARTQTWCLPRGSLRRPASDNPSSVLVILDDEKESTRVLLTDRSKFRDVSPPIRRAPANSIIFHESGERDVARVAIPIPFSRSNSKSRNFF